MVYFLMDVATTSTMQAEDIGIHHFFQMHINPFLRDSPLVKGLIMVEGWDFSVI